MPILETASKWADAAVANFKVNKRKIKVFFENLDGQSVFIPKYLTPIKPPPDIYDNNF